MTTPKFRSKVCLVCGIDKPLTEYYLHTDKYSRKTCKKCSNRQAEENRNRTPEQKKELDRARNLMNKYGITIHQYAELLKKQDDKCAICDRHKDEFKSNLAVDHNHATGEIRGLLCSYCNHRVIGRHRNGDLLRKMAAYVDGGTGWFVPKKKRTIKRKPK